MVTLNHHGGGCCGVKHIYNFPLNRVNPGGTLTGFVPGDENIRNVLEEVGRLIDTVSPRGRVYEITLTERQIEYYGQGLIDAGFSLVTYFHNENSGNNVGIFHYAPTRIEVAPSTLPRVLPKNRVLRTIRQILRENGGTGR